MGGCSACGHQNPAGARFCGSCAAPLEQSIECPSCGAANAAGHRFCNACAGPLAERGESSAAGVVAPAGELRPDTPEHLAEKIRAGRAALEGERKQVTVLFADVLGSMELAEQTDPEPWRAIMDRFFGLLSDGVHRFEGTVDKFTGDGIMAIFGAPIAHEDHARRACYGALHLQRELAAYAAELRRTHGLNLSVRIGLNSGEVVVGAIGEQGSMAYTAVGHTVGLAQRMEQLAAPDRIYLSEHTAALAEGYFTLDDLGPFEVKGAGKLHVFELTGTGAARGALDVARARGLSRFVGRTEELRTLEGAREQAFAGHGQVVGIVGEAGVGKSRLCHELAERQRATGTPVYYLAGQAHATSVPLMPLLGFLRSYFEITEADSQQTARERIAGKLLLLDESFADELPLLFDFLAVPDAERPVERMDPEARQRRLLELMKRLTRAQSAAGPGLIVFEDLHWLDPATEVFLANHIEAVQGTRGLTVLNFRPEYQAPWMARSYYRQIALAPLGARAAEELLAELVGSDPSLDGLAELVRERTQGNPFFIEELVRSLAEAGSLEGEQGGYRLAAPLEDAAVPASVQAVLSARIDRLPSREKAVLQAAAVIGKELSQPVLERVAGLNEAELANALRKLVAGELVYEQELYPEAVYAFKHPVTQEVAYRSQLKERRARVHAAVARAIAEEYPERLDESAALVAGHWEAAGEHLQAARWHARAAVWLTASSPAEGMRHWRKVRELTDHLEPSAEADGFAIAARIWILALAWRLGVPRAEVAAIYSEGTERTGGSSPGTATPSVERALLDFAYVSNLIVDGREREGMEMITGIVRSANEIGDPGLIATVSGPAAFSTWVAGSLRDGHQVADRALAETGHDPRAGEGLVFGCPVAFCLWGRAICAGYLGRLDEAWRDFERAIELAREHGDLEQEAYALNSRSGLHLDLSDHASALRDAERALEIAQRIGNLSAINSARTDQAFALAKAGEHRAAAEIAGEALASARQRRAGLEMEPVMLAALATARLGLGQREEARAAAEEGVEVADERTLGGIGISVRIALAQVLIATEGAGAASRVEAVLGRALELIRTTGAVALEPSARSELATLADLLGDEPRAERERAEAKRIRTRFVVEGGAGADRGVASKSVS